MTVPAAPAAQLALGPTDFAWVTAFLRERTGIELRPGKEALVEGRLGRRVRHHGMASFAEYFSLVSSGRDPEETRLAVDLLTTNETYFFREPAHFDVLRDHVRALPAAAPVRVWSAASSSGQEAYTAAMVLATELADRPWEVLGTDISHRVLETARRGVYPLDAADRIPQPLLRRFCLRGRDEYEGVMAIGTELRPRVRFRHANLLELPGDLGSFDVVFLRNVMIYFGLETKRDLVRRIAGQLRPGGLLLVSHSETLTGLDSGLQAVSPSVYRQATR